MINDTSVFHYINYIVCALNVRHPKFYRMLALFHRKYFSPSYRGGGKASRKGVDQTPVRECGRRAYLCRGAIRACPFSLFVSSICDFGISFGDSGPWAMIATSFNTGALNWWKANVMLGRGRHLFHSLLVYAFHSSSTGREAVTLAA